MEKIILSIIIPTYKRNDNLANAIESIFKQEGSYEVIVVDDNNSDTEYRKKNEKMMLNYSSRKNFTYLKHDHNKNGAAARNTGISIAKGEYITFLDDDDEFCNNRIKSIQDICKETSAYFICSGVIMKKDGLVEKKIMPVINGKDINDIIFDLLSQKSFFETGSNIICKKNIVDEIGGFDEAFIRHQDIEFVIRFLQKINNIEDIKIINNYSVIKNKDDSSNVPDFDKMITVKELFLEKFDSVIKKYPEEKKNKIYEANYYQLLKNAYNKENKEDIIKCINLLKKNNIYSGIKVIKIKAKIKLKKLKIIKFIGNIINK